MMMMPGLLRRSQVWTKIARLNSQHNLQNPQTARRKRNWLRRIKTMRKRKCSRWRLQWPPRRKQVWICRKGKLKNTLIWILNTKHLNPQTEQRKRNWLKRMMEMRRRRVRWDVGHWDGAGGNSGYVLQTKKICRVKLEFKHANILQKTDAFSYWSREGLL